MYNFTFDKNRVLMQDDIINILQKFQSQIAPELKRKMNYYLGKHDIIYKKYENSNRIPNRIVTNFVKSIVDSYVGYGMGIAPKIEITESAEELDNILKYNDYASQFINFYKNGLIYGRGVIINYIDSDGQVRFCSADVTNVIPVYTDDLERELLYAIRFWSNDSTSGLEQEFYVDLYTDTEIIHYKSAAGFNTLNPLGSERHNFPFVPITIMSINEEEVGVAEPIFKLNDAYNTLISDAADDADAFADSMLVLTGAFADEDDVDSMKKNRVLMLDEGSSAEYLTKDAKLSGADSLLDKCEDKIREITGCPNMADESFGTSSGIAIRYRLLAMENATAGFLGATEKAIRRIIELISGVERLKGNDAMWRDAVITFTRNIPVNEVENANVVAQLQGIVSDETLMKLLPFVTDIKDEIKKINKQKEQGQELFLENQDFSPEIINDEEKDS